MGHIEKHIVEIDSDKIYSVIKNKWLPFSPEEKLRQEFISRLINFYGYSIEQLDQDLSLDNGQNLDVAIWKDSTAKKSGQYPDILILVKCKPEYIKVLQEEYISDYLLASLSGASFFIAHNLQETRVFYLDKEANPCKIERIGDLPSAKDISSKNNLSTFILNNRSYSKDNFLQILSRCHNIIRNIDKLSPEAAFDEISKVLFIKMMFEKGSNLEMVYTWNRFLSNEKEYKKHSAKDDYISFLFNQTKDKFVQDGIFENKDTIKIKRESLELLIKELEKINLYDTSEDIKGIAFESFLGKTFRGELGQFFTPRSVVDYMIEVIDPKEGELICDPCCGSGGFLIKTFDYIRHKIDISIRSEVEKIKDSLMDSVKKQNAIIKCLKESDPNLKGSRYYKLCNESIYGVDANPRMARTSKMNMIMHGDGHVGVYLHDGLLNVGGVFDGRFDVIITNPPFGAKVEKIIRVTHDDIPTEGEKNKYINLFGDKYRYKVYNHLVELANQENTDGIKGTPVTNLFEINSNLTEVLFIERCLNLLKPGGRLAIVLPEGILNNDKQQKIREFIESKAKILNITSIPADVFLASGATIKPSLVFLQKYNEGECDNNLQHLDDYNISVTNVSDAGITSIGLPSNHNELPYAAIELKEWINNHKFINSKYTKIVSRKSLTNWSVAQCFTNHISYNPNYNLIKLKDILKKSSRFFTIKDSEKYKRITIRLFNKGIALRDEIQGKNIGTKRQNRISTGQFAISKIDGRSGAFGIIPKELDGAIVTPDFLIYDINSNLILPEYLELALSNKNIQEQLDSTSSGTTRRRRLSEQVFMNIMIPLPSVKDQEEMITDILKIRKEIEELTSLLELKKEQFTYTLLNNED